MSVKMRPSIWSRGGATRASARQPRPRFARGQLAGRVGYRWRRRRLTALGLKRRNLISAQAPAARPRRRASESKSESITSQQRAVKPKHLNPHGARARHHEKADKHQASSVQKMEAHCLGKQPYCAKHRTPRNGPARRQQAASTAHRAWHKEKRWPSCDAVPAHS